MSRALVVITRHAVSRFIKRHAPHLSEGEAKRHLEQAAATAGHLKEKTVLGQHQWQVEDPHCVLVMKQDGRKMICVTVLPEPEIAEILEGEEGERFPLVHRRRHRWRR
jgi:hypothetical protein